MNTVSITVLGRMQVVGIAGATGAFTIAAQAVGKSRFDAEELWAGLSCSLLVNTIIFQEFSPFFTTPIFHQASSGVLVSQTRTWEVSFRYNGASESY